MVERENQEQQTPADSVRVLETAERADPQDGLVHPPLETIPVVGMGGSAGSLSALSSIVAKIPPDSGAAYVIVVHLAPDYQYMLPEILQRETSLPVKQVEGKAVLEKNQIYIISPGKQLCISGGVLEASDLDRPKDGHETIGMFTRSLAEAHGGNSCAIVLTVAASDGAMGLNRETRCGDLQSINGEVITCIDITERKKNEELRRWLSSIVEFSNDAVISFTLEGNVVSWNKGAERIFGYTADEIIGQSQSILAPESLQGEKRELLRKLQSGELIEPFETVRICKDGMLIDVSLSASVIRDDSGKIVGATAIAQDISARKQKVEDLRQAHDELEEKIRERTVELRKRVGELARLTSELTFAEERERKRMARILHDELQQLLVSAKMSIENLTGLDDEERKQEISNLTETMDKLISSSRSLSIELSPPVLSETLGRALDWLCHTWMPEQHNLCVHACIDLSLDALSEDIRSIVFYSVRELLFNVVKHSMEMEAYVDLTLHGDGNLKLSVRDHGLGFDLRALGPESAAATGFGLIGLRERLEMLGGEFHVRSQPNEGVEAIIIIPGKTNEDE